MSATRTCNLPCPWVEVYNNGTRTTAELPPIGSIIQVKIRNSDISLGPTSVTASLTANGSKTSLHTCVVLSAVDDIIDLDQWTARIFLMRAFSQAANPIDHVANMPWESRCQLLPLPAETTEGPSTPADFGEPLCPNNYVAERDTWLWVNSLQINMRQRKYRMFDPHANMPITEMRRIQAYARSFDFAFGGANINDPTTRAGGAKESDGSSGNNSKDAHGGLGWAGAGHGAIGGAGAISGGAPAHAMNLMNVMVGEGQIFYASPIYPYTVVRDEDDDDDDCMTETSISFDQMIAMAAETSPFAKHLQEQAERLRMDENRDNIMNWLAMS